MNGSSGAADSSDSRRAYSSSVPTVVYAGLAGAERSGVWGGAGGERAHTHTLLHAHSLITPSASSCFRIASASFFCNTNDFFFLAGLPSTRVR